MAVEPAVGQRPLAFVVRPLGLALAETAAVFRRFALPFGAGAAFACLSQIDQFGHGCLPFPSPARIWVRGRFPRRVRFCYTAGRVAIGCCPIRRPRPPVPPAQRHGPTVKTSLIGLAVALLLLVAGALVAPSFIDWNPYRAQIATRLSQITGHAVTIDGTVDLRMLPTPIMRASGVRVANARGDGSHPHMLQVAAADLRVAMLPLLRGLVQVERVVLIEPAVVIERLPDGRLNWTREDGAFGADSVQLDRVTIENGRIVWHDPGAGSVRTVTEVFGQLSAASLSGPYSLLGSFRAGDIPYAIDLQTGRRSPAGALPINLTLGVDGAGDELRFAGLVGGDAPIQGDLTLSGNSLGRLVQRLAPDLLDTRLPPLPYRVQTPLLYDGASVRLAGIGADLGDGRATGTASLTLEAPRRLTASIGITRLDGDAWAEMATTLSGDGDPVAAAERLLANLDGLDVDAELSLDTLTLSGGLVRQVRIDLVAADGVVEVPYLSAQLPGTTDILLNGSLRKIEGELHAELATQVTSGDLRLALAWLGLEVEAVPSDRLRQFSGVARFSGGPRQFQLSGVDLALDNARLTGGLAFIDRGRIGLGVRLALDRLNLDAYRPADAVGRGWAEPIAAWLADAKSTAPVLELLEDLDANIDARIGRLTANGLTADGLRFDGTLRQGSLVVREAGVDALAGARLHLGGEADRLLPPTGLDVSFDAAVDSLPLFLDRLGLPPADGAALDWLGRVALSGTVRGEPERLEVDLDGRLAEAEVQAVGDLVGPFGDDPTGRLVLRVRHEDPLPLAQRFELPLPAAALAGGVDLYGEVTREPGRYRVDGLQGTVGPLALAGSLTVEARQPRPRIDADLRTSALVLDHYLPPRRPQPAPAMAAGLRWSFLPVDFSPLGRFDGTLAMNSTALQWGDVVIDDPILRASLAGGILDLSTFLGHVLGGRLGGSGALELGADDAPPEARLTVNLVDAPADGLLSFLLGLDGVEGTLDFGAEVETRGGSPAEWIAGLSGSGLVAIRDGVVHGIDLAALAQRLTALQRPLDFIEVTRQTLTQGTTPFAALNATYRLENGVARTDDLRVVGPDGVGEGQGFVDLNNWAMDLATEFSLYMVPEAPAVGVQIVGPLEAPERRLNAQALQVFVAQRAAEALSRRVLEGANPIEADILGDGVRRADPDDIPGLLRGR